MEPWGIPTFNGLEDEEEPAQETEKEEPPEKGGKLGECDATEAKGGESFKKRKVNNTAE